MEDQDELESDLEQRIALWAKHGISAGRIPKRQTTEGAVATIAAYTHGPVTPGFHLVCERVGPEAALEALVLEHPRCFSEDTVEAAEGRLRAVDPEMSRLSAYGPVFDEDPEAPAQVRDPLDKMDDEDERRADYLADEDEDVEESPSYREFWDE